VTAREDIFHWKKFRVMKIVLKLRLHVVAMKLVQYFLKKYNADQHIIKGREGIPNEVYNTHFFVVWDAFEESVRKHWFTYKRIDIDNPTPHDYNNINQYYNRDNTHWYGIPKFFLRILLTIALEDTHYREQLKFFLFELQEKMNRYYNPEIQHKVPLYMSQYDTFLPYFVEYMKIQGGGKAMIDIKPDEDKEKYVPDKKKVNLKMDKQVVDKLAKLDPYTRKEFMKGMNRFMYKMIQVRKDNKDGRKVLKQMLGNTAGTADANS